MNSWRYILLILALQIKSILSNRRERPSPLLDRLINPNTVCGNTAGLNVEQSYLCSRNPHSVASAIQGLQVGLHECKVQFKDHLWNCSALETRNKLPQTSPFLRHAHGNRESAFAFAIASAGVVHQVAHACSLGKIKECECRQSQPPHLTASQRKKIHKQLDQGFPDARRHSQTFERTGCSHNINFGMDFAVKFLDSQDERDFVSKIQSHNNRVGRLIVANNMRRNCRCHGTSGSCSMQTCWRETPDFKAVGLKIKKKYDNAVKVSTKEIGNRARNNHDVSSQSTSGSSYNVKDLIYFEESPNYCRPNRRYNLAGTSGRICNHTVSAEAPNSCEKLCCSRGYTVRTIRRVEQCRCRFHWCCDVTCEQCEWEETVSVCN